MATIKEQSLVGIDINAQDQGAKYSSMAAESSIRGTKTLMQTINTLVGQGVQFAVAKQKENKAKLDDEAIQKGIVDGTLNVPDDQYVADIIEGDDVYTTARNEARRKSVASNVSREYNTRAAELSEMYKADPDSLRVGLDDLQKQMSEDLKLDNDGKVVLDKVYKSSLDRYMPRATQQGYEQAKQEESQAQTDLLTETVKLGLNDIRNGDLSQVESLALTAEEIFDNGVERGIFDEGQKQDYINKIRLEANEQGVKGQVEKLVSANAYDEARDVLDEWVQGSRKKGTFTPDQIDSVSGGIGREINQAQRANEYEKQQAMKQGLDDLQNQMKINQVSTAFKTAIPLPKNKESQSAVDAYYDSNPDQFDTSTETGKLSTAEFISRVGIIPSTVSNSIRGQMLSNDPEIVSSGAVMWSAALDANPGATTQAFTKEQNAFYSNFKSLTEAGLDGETAIERSKSIAYGLDDDVNKTIKSRMTNQEFEDQILSAAQDNIDDQVGLFSFSPDIEEPLTGSTQYATDYATIYRSNYLATNGNEEQARKLTNGEISRVWSISQINGSNEIMKYSPEALVGDINLLKSQWESEKENIRKNETLLSKDAEILLESDLSTAQNVNNPSWAVMVKYIDDQGIEFVSPYFDKLGRPVRMKFDIKESDAYKEQEEANNETYNKAKEARENPVDYQTTADFITKFDIKR